MTLMLLDSASLWYRAYYGMPDTLLAPDGTPVNAIRGYLDMTARLMNTYKPTRLVACIEGDWRPTWRTDLFPGYKANRVDAEGEEEEPDLLSPQIPILLDILETFGIVTGDRDLFQLVDDKRDVKVVYLAKGITNHDLVDIAFVANKYAIPGDRYALFAMIRGDASDGLPGIKGIGEKGAALIANQFSSMEEVMEAAGNEDERLTPNLRKKLLESAEYAAIAPTLVHCAKDIDLPKVDFSLPRPPQSLDEIYQYKSDYGLGASIDRLISALNW